MKASSLFAGIGGFDLAFQRASITVTDAIELDAKCRAVLARHFPATRLHADIREVRPDELRPDVMAGGFPCQDISVAGHRAGLAGSRSGLWWEFVRLIDGCHPRWVVVENVPGLLSSGGGRDMGAVVGALGELGYGWAYRVLDAQYFGVAQHRERVFIVGRSGDRRASVRVLFESDRGARNLEAGRPARTFDAGGSAGGTGAVSSTLTARGPGALDDNAIEQLVVGAVTTKFACGADEIMAQAGHLIPLYYSHDYNQDRIGRKAQIAAAGGNAAALAGATVRKLTPVECERLQGFPDGWTEPHAKTVRYRMIGNAVAVPVAEWIVRRIAAEEAKEGVA